MTRRVKSLLTVSAMVAAAAAQAAPIPGGTQDPLAVPKYVEKLVVPPAMPVATDALGAPIPNTYDIAVREIVQQVLPAGFPRTTVWAYGSPAANNFNYPAFTIEAVQHQPTTVLWRNELFDQQTKEFIPHRLPIDQTLHWANPAGPIDSRPVFVTTPGTYTGPVPIITHLHGGHIEPESDGYPEAWYLPAAANVTDCLAPGAVAGSCYFTQGSNWGTSPNVPEAPPPGAAYAWYKNDQPAGTLWYHDHALGITRANVYMGMAGFYLLRDEYEKQLQAANQLPSGAYEIPLAIQDRSFDADGKLFYPANRAFFDGFPGPFIPATDVPPIWNPEFFGNHMLVNGKTWPKLAVEPRKYRFRVLNGCDSRFLILAFGDTRLRPKGGSFTVIGNDGGFLRGAPVAMPQLLLGPGERYDVVVDFAPFAGQRVILLNLAPDEPFGGGRAIPGFGSDPATTGQVMAFDVATAAPGFVDTVVLPALLDPPLDPFAPPPGVAGAPRVLTLNEIVSAVPKFGGPIEAQLGTALSALPWKAPISENIPQDAVEEWNILNLTVDAHPIHLHQVQFQIVDRVPFDVPRWEAAVAGCNLVPPVGVCPPVPADFVKKNVVRTPVLPYETGPKDTVVANPGEITRVRALFDIAGLYVWHCHILSHEDNEMMRPFCVTNAAVPACVK